MDIARGSHHGLVVPISCTTHFSHILFCFWNPKQKSIEFPSNSKCLCIHVCLLCFDFISINVTSSSHNKAWYLFRYIYVKNWHGMVLELYNIQECSFKGDVYELWNLLDSLDLIFLFFLSAIKHFVCNQLIFWIL